LPSEAAKQAGGNARVHTLSPPFESGRRLPQRPIPAAIPNGSRILLAFCRNRISKEANEVPDRKDAQMNPRKLIVTMAALALLAGAGVAGAVAGNSTSSPATTTAPPTTTCPDDQGQQGENDEQEAADAVDTAATQVDQEAARAQADDQAGDDQGDNSQGDEQGDNQNCDD
jgi:hypothetical protein